MKRIVSVSLGSSKRDHRADSIFSGEKCQIQRMGTDGDVKKAIRLIKDLDGKVDAFGMGGISLYLYGKNNHRYTLRSALPMLGAVNKTPIVDGSGLKNSLEANVVRYLKEGLGIPLETMKVFMVCGMERFGMAEAFPRLGSRMVYGDIMFAIGLPVPIKTLKGLHEIAGLLMPIVGRLPLRMLYPSGQGQEQMKPKFESYYNDADIIAGDFLYIKKHMPMSLEGKIIVTNTITERDLQLLKERGAKMLVTTTPDVGGRSFGTNVMEAVVVAILGKNPSTITAKEYQRVLSDEAFRPRVVYFN
ncbi:MAG TPA: quinate 5-dehydrogenase [Bacillota bacterium]|nr:quinate 5-dehydrogenase [Bacillota bacterium]